MLRSHFANIVTTSLSNYVILYQGTKMYYFWNIVFFWVILRPPSLFQHLQWFLPEWKNIWSLCHTIFLCKFLIKTERLYFIIIVFFFFSFILIFLFFNKLHLTCYDFLLLRTQMRNGFYFIYYFIFFIFLNNF
jgi:hypothetical protein